jgi:DNA-binding transcriptional regulator WhiA
MKYTKSLQDYLTKRVQKEVNDLKTESGQERKKLALAKVIAFSKLPLYRVASIFEMQMHLAKAKKIIINKLNKASKLSTFLKTNSGFRVTGEEGYVAIDRKGNTVKLVDRLEFSYSNFNPEIVKGWTNDNRR